jgi:hypothetical protein
MLQRLMTSKLVQYTWVGVSVTIATVTAALVLGPASWRKKYTVTQLLANAGINGIALFCFYHCLKQLRDFFSKGTDMNVLGVPSGRVHRLSCAQRMHTLWSELHCRNKKLNIGNIGTHINSPRAIDNIAVGLMWSCSACSSNVDLLCPLTCRLSVVSWVHVVASTSYHMWLTNRQQLQR